MPVPDVPARPSPYTGGINRTYPGSAQSPSTTRLPLIPSGTEGKGFARGWLRPLLRFVKPSGTRQQLQRTDTALQSGPGPAMIHTLFTDKSHGLVGPNVNTYPATGGEAYIPHQNINRRDAGKVGGSFGRTFDDGVHIPAIYAGNPPKG